MAAAVALLAVCASVSTAACQDRFTYVNHGLFRRADSDEECKVCYGDNDCLTMNQARCEYYTAASEVLSDDVGPADSSNPDLKFEVDSLMTDLVEQYTSRLTSQDCMPFVSEYTDCTKENICLGCHSCACSEEGRWNCSSVQSCTAEDQVQVDHRALVIVIETFRGDGSPSFRLKRSATSTATTKSRRVTFEELAKWFYGVKPFNHNIDINDTEATSTVGTTDTKNDTRTSVDKGTTRINNIITTESDYIAFEDVLKNNYSDDEKFNNKKAQYASHRELSTERNLIHDDNVNVTFDYFNGMRADQFVQFLNTVQDDPDSTTERVNKFVIDLLEMARKRLEATENGLDSNDTDKVTTLQNDTANGCNSNPDDTDSIYNNNVINIVKRDVSQVTEKNNSINTTDNSNSTNTSSELKDSVYLPINNMIQDKLKELEDLMHVRENLINILKLDRNKEYAILNKSEQVENGSNSFISFYNLHIVPQSDDEFKRSGTNLLDKYLSKLRRDIYVVVKDIISIQTITGPKDLPRDVKLLTRAIRHFMRNHTQSTTHHSHKKSKLRSMENNNDLRRHQDNSYMVKDLVTKYLIKILLLMDKDIPQSNALAPLSTNMRKIMKRVIKHNKMDELSEFGLKVNDPNYNLTNDLKSIGVKWQDMTAKISDSSPWDRLYNMKRLQFILEMDIDKMKNALALLDYAHSRRMVQINNKVTEDDLSRINDNLKLIHSKMKEIRKLRTVFKPKSKIIQVFTITKPSKKETFLKHIRNLLRSSKQDIVNLLHRKVPKSEIVKQLAKKKLNELTKKKLIEYENVMQKWQANLDITRKKRSFDFDKMKSRIKNILPKYLRGKVSSGMNSTKNKSKSHHTQRRSNRKNKNKNTAAKNTTVKERSLTII